YLWTLPMFHANGWTFVWTVTAVGATHVCLPKIDPRAIFELMAREQITILCAAPTVLISLANAPEDVRHLAPKGIRIVTAGAPPDGITKGEIVARGNVIMAGYYNDKKATDRALHGGWFHTGDAAVVHPDGYIEIRDRLKDVIISGGENISSIEVESVLLRHPA